MTIFEFVLILAGLGVTGLGYILAYRNLKKQVKELKKELEEQEKRK